MRGKKKQGEWPDRNMSAFLEMIETQISFKHSKTRSYTQNLEYSSPTAPTLANRRLRLGRCCAGKIEVCFLPKKNSSKKKFVPKKVHTTFRPISYLEKTRINYVCAFSCTLEVALQSSPVFSSYLKRKASSRFLPSTGHQVRIGALHFARWPCYYWLYEANKYGVWTGSTGTIVTQRLVNIGRPVQLKWWTEVRMT
jgi:hypothetical protein